MALSNAERQRRYRDRKRAEQGKGKPAPAAVEAVTPPVTDVVTPVPGLGERGQWLWAQVTAEAGELRPTERVTLEEACRSADRLDQLDRILAGTADNWLAFHAANEDGSAVKVVVTGVLVEVRQQQMTLARLLAELRQSRSAGGKQPAGGRRPPVSAGGDGAGGITDLTARIARRAQSAG